jgi:hypothetical protein
MLTTLLVEKKLGMILGVLVCTLLLSAAAKGQLLVENFDYPVGDTLLSHGWVITGTSTVNSILVTAPGLTYSGYASSGVGNATTLNNTGQDVNRSFGSVTSGSLYASLLVKITTAQSGDYFFHFTRTAAPTTDFFARLFVRMADNGNLAFGISKTSISASIPATYSDSIYTTGATYLIVTKYKFNSGSTTDDEVSLFVFTDPTLPSTEPVTPTVGPVTSTQTDVAELGLVALRQGTSTSAPTLVLDGIRIGTRWEDVVASGPTSVERIASVPTEFQLFQNYPNPFNPATKIQFETPNASFVTLKVYNLLGQEVTTLVNEFLPAGKYRTEFDASRLPSGMYLYRLQAGSFDEVKKMTVLK